MKKLLTALIIFLFVVDFSYSQNTWTYVSALPSPSPAGNSLAVVDANILWVAATATGGAARCYRSVNGGTTWLLRNGGLPAQDLYGISALDSLFAVVGTVAGSVYKTTNGGLNWALVMTGGNFTNGLKMFNANYGVFIGDPASSGQQYQFRVTNNGGNNWYLVPGAPVAGSEFGVINAWDWTDTNHFWMGSANTVTNSTNAKVYRTSTGFYGTWSSATVPGTGGSSGMYYQAVAFVNNTNGIIGSSGANLKKTTDGGVSWTDCAVPPGLGLSYAIMNASGLKDGSNTIRISVDSGGVAKVYRTTNLGTSWVNEPLPIQASANTVSHLVFVNQNLGFGLLGSQSVPLGGLIKYGPTSGINPVNGEVPESFSLGQNYPNPFNPTTNINFSIVKSGFVKLVVYDALGKVVETLLSESMMPGKYTVTYDASKLNTGIYFYKLTSNGISETKKMMLVK